MATWIAGDRLRWRTWTPDRRFLALLLVLFLAKGIVTTFVFPPFSGHDEVAHFAYLDFLASERRLPVIPDLEEWRAEFDATQDQTIHDHVPAKLYPYCEFFTKDWWKQCTEPNVELYYAVKWPLPDGIVFYPSGWIYTANHPPLYYLMMLPVYWLSSGGSVETQLYALRLAAIPFGLIAVFFTWLAARVIFPRDWFVAMLAPAFVALQPQVSYEATMFNNDIVSIALTSVIYYLLALALRRGFSWKLCVLTGFCFGLAMLAKNTSAVSGVVIASAMILGLGLRNWRLWVSRGIVAAGVAMLLIWPWYLYLWRTYGNLTALDRIRDLQERWNYDGGEAPTVWAQLADREFAWARWGETWGQFGWRKIPLDDRLLLWILAGCVIGIVGVLVFVLRDFSTRGSSDTIAIKAIVVLITACVVSYYAVLQFGTTFSLTQARYYFPAIGAVALLLAFGYRTLIPARWHAIGAASLFLAMVVLNIAIFSGYVIPFWLGDL